MIKTLFDIDYLAQYEPYHISRKRGKVREMEYKRKVDGAKIKKFLKLQVQVEYLLI